MKKTRKLLSILLALIMALSLCTVAFAEGDEPEEPQEPEVVYNWVPIPTSAEGLAKGAYWLDFDSLKAAYVQMEVEDAIAEAEEPMTEEQIAALTAAIEAEIDGELASLISGSYFFDAEKFALKAVIPVRDEETGEPVLDEETGEPMVEEHEDGIEMLAMYTLFLDVDILKQVGTDWVLVKPADAELQDGDYYFDKDAAIAAYREGMMAYYKSVIPKPEELSDEAYEAVLASEVDEAVAGFEENMLGVITELFANKEASDLFQYKAVLKIPETTQQPKLDNNQQPVLDPETQQPVMEEVPVLDEEGNPVFHEQTITYAYYFKIMPIFMEMMTGEGYSEDELASMLLPYDAIKAGIKQYKVEKPEDKPSDKDEDGGYSNNAFMKFIKKIIQWFKDLFSKIFK